MFFLFIFWIMPVEAQERNFSNKMELQLEIHPVFFSTFLRRADLFKI